MKKILAFVLAVIIGVSASMNAFAASAKKTYISDIVAVTAKDEADAKAQLEKDGYKLLSNSNVNSTLKTGVYIGYKETDNADEAITDIAGMNMTGKFNYSDYKAIMEQNKEQIKETIDNFEPVIAEFQTNYEAGKPTALAAYKSLNVFKDDDSGKFMGDYLLEYDFSDASEKNMTDTFMQANSKIILTIMQQAAFAGDDNDNTMIDRLTELGPDGVSAKYKGLYPSIAKANQAMAAEYGNTAAEIYKDWDSVYNYICEAEKNIKVDEDGVINASEDMFKTEKINEEDYKNIEDEKVKDCIKTVNTVTEMADITKDEINYAFYNLLSMTEYGDGTLLDFFNRPASEVKKEELYPFVDAMSDGQHSQIAVNGLLLTLESALGDVEEDSEEAEDVVEDVENATDMVGETSIYYGVDRSVFEDGVAFTSAATEHENLTGESWLSKLGIENEKGFWLTTSVVTTFISGILIAAVLKSSSVQKALISAEKASVETANKQYNTARANYENLTKRYVDVKQEYYELSKGIKTVDGKKELIKDLENLPEYKYEFQGQIKAAKADYDAALDELNHVERTFEDPNVGRTAGIVKCVSFVMLVVMLAVDAYAIYEYVTADEPQEEKIPHHIMTAATTEYGEDYVYYAAVKNLNGEAADTNNHEADAKIGWLTLYTTKDKAAGNPILTENFKLQTGSSSFKEGASFVHLFNESAALNLTDEKYTGVKDSMNGTYITFNRAASTLVGSVVTNGTAAIIGVGSLALGALLGAMITKLAGRKKKEEVTAEA